MVSSTLKSNKNTALIPPLAWKREYRWVQKYFIKMFRWLRE